MSACALMSVLDSSQQIPIGGTLLIGRESGKTFEDGRKVRV
jgi:hypothetical protein